MSRRLGAAPRRQAGKVRPERSGRQKTEPDGACQTGSFAARAAGNSVSGVEGHAGPKHWTPAEQQGKPSLQATSHFNVGGSCSLVSGKASASRYQARPRWIASGLIWESPYRGEFALGSSVVEQPPCKRQVVGSTPARCASISGDADWWRRGGRKARTPSLTPREASAEYRGVGWNSAARASGPCLPFTALFPALALSNP